MRRPRARSASARGAAAVEFALVLPLLLAVCLGAIEWGFHFYEREIVVNAAREGARAGSIADAAGDPGGTAELRAKAYLSFSGIDPTACTATADADTTLSIRLTVSCPGGSFTKLFETFIPANIVATAEMRREPGAAAP